MLKVLLGFDLNWWELCIYTPLSKQDRTSNITSFQTQEWPRKKWNTSSDLIFLSVSQFLFPFTWYDPHDAATSNSWKTLMCQRYCEVLYHDLFPQRLFVAWKRCDTKMCFDGVFHTWMYFIFWSRLKLIWWSAASWQKSKMAISKDQILHLSESHLFEGLKNVYP